jgi:flagellar hook-associated protein 3 FlgL
MRVVTNTLSNEIVRQIQQLGSKQAKLQNQVATGQRIFQPEDDPTAVGRVLNLESEQRNTTQYQQNATRAMELSQASYSGLQSVKKVSDRATEIGTLGTSIISPSAANAYASEINQLIEQTVQLANTRFRNDYIFAGTAVDAPPYAAARDPQGNVTGVTYGGNAQQQTIQLTESSSISPTTTNATNTGLQDFINDLVGLRDALLANSSSAVATAQTGLLAGEDLLVSSLADQGGVQTRIEATQTQLAGRANDLESLVSSETDADLPTTVVRLNQAQTAYQAALQSAANIMQVSLLDYLK